MNCNCIEEIGTCFCEWEDEDFSKMTRSGWAFHFISKGKQYHVTKRDLNQLIEFQIARNKRNSYQ